MSTLYLVFQQTMFFTIPLLLVALGGMFSERSGIINIALEGIMIMGAFTSILFINLAERTGAAVSRDSDCGGDGDFVCAVSRVCRGQYES